ncbi:hypothetical protein ACC741_38605, partial [Rhizobium johnstonii]|uniref:hypothetical protein n=1 Tax=Rhizobium johnstonii TaxID=3019933 RepID=UPI003F9849CE
SEMALLGGYAERRIRCAISPVSASPLDDFKEKAFAETWAVELKIFSLFVVSVSGRPKASRRI